MFYKYVCSHKYQYRLNDVQCKMDYVDLCSRMVQNIKEIASD